MAQSRTLFLGMDVHQATMAVADVAQEHGAEVTSLGPMGTRQCDIDHLLRTMPSKATHLLFVSEAGPCGSWRYRSLRNKDDDCWVVAPSLLPKKTGDRVKTDRRDARQRARLARASTPGARVSLAFVPGGRGSAGLVWRAMPGGRTPGGGHGYSDTV
jgi:transposase